MKNNEVFVTGLTYGDIRSVVSSVGAKVVDYNEKGRYIGRYGWAMKEPIIVRCSKCCRDKKLYMWHLRNNKVKDCVSCKPTAGMVCVWCNKVYKGHLMSNTCGPVCKKSNRQSKNSASMKKRDKTLAYMMYRQIESLVKTEEDIIRDYGSYGKLKIIEKNFRRELKKITGECNEES